MGKPDELLLLQRKIGRILEALVTLIDHQAKRQKNMTHNEENNQSMERDPEMMLMLELAKKDTKSVIITFEHMKFS